MDFKRYYTDPNFSGSFTGINTFYRELKKLDPNVSKGDVKKFLKSSNPYTLHKPIKRPKQFRKVYTKGIKYLYQMDLIVLPDMTQDNDGYTYLVVIIDTFSKFGWVFPSKTKSGKEVLDKIKALLLVERPDKIQTDRGLEFYNSKFKALLSALGIKHYSTNSPLKASIAERFNRTLMTRLERVFTFQGNRRYVEILPQVVKAYNNHPLYGSLRRIVEPTLFAGLCRPPRGSWRDSRCAKTISEKCLTDPCSPRVDLSWGTNIFKIDKS